MQLIMLYMQFNHTNWRFYHQKTEFDQKIMREPTGWMVGQWGIVFGASPGMLGYMDFSEL